MGIKNVSIQNFTVFEDIKIDFASGVNVIIGENGTGKTHILKGLYAILKDENAKKITAERYKSYFGSDYNGTIGEFTLRKSNVNKPIFIPAKDILTHSRGLSQMVKKYSKDMPFDKTLLDIIDVSLQWKVDEFPIIGKAILPKLEKLIDGKVIVENDTFFVEKTNGKRIEFSVEAEGIKKIAILWQLIMNESITKDSVLFWDEPEANINPSLYKDVCEILLELSRNGVQIFLATHNYNFVKYIEVLMKESDDVAFHSLYKTDKGVKCETDKTFRNLKQNKIISSFDKLLDEVFDLNIGD